MGRGFKETIVKKGAIIIICLLLLTACAQQHTVVVSDGAADWTWGEEDSTPALGEQEGSPILGEQELILESEEGQEEASPSPAYLRTGVTSWRNTREMFTVNGFIENTGGTQANSFTITIYYQGPLGQVYEKHEHTHNRPIPPESNTTFTAVNSVSNHTLVKKASASIKLHY